MTRRNGILLSLGFIFLTGFFTWFLAAQIKKEKSGDARAEIEKNLLEVKDPSDKSVAKNASPTLTPPVAKSSAQTTSPQIQTHPSQTPAEKQINDLDNNPPETAVPILKKFQSENLGISFEHPEGYEIEEKIRSVVVKKDAELFRLKIYENEEKAETQVWYEDNFRKKDNTDCQFSDSGIKIGNWGVKDVKKGTAAEGKCLDAGSYALIVERGKMLGVFVQDGMSLDEEARKILESVSVL